MNRTELVQRCLTKGVAEAGEIERVVHFLHEYLFSSLRRGQAVSIPGFGTFRTRLAGVKTFRRVPSFEPEQSLAGRVNDRFRGLSHIVTGTYQEASALGGLEYTGRPAPYDTILEHTDTQRILDTFKEVRDEEFERQRAERQRTQQQEEVHTMPRLNLKDDSLESEEPLESDQSTAPPPTLRDVGGGGGGKGMSTILLVVLILLVLAAAAFALNYFGVVHLWGKKAPEVTEAIPEPDLPMPETTTEGETAPPEDASLAPAATIPEPAASPEVSPPVTAQPRATTPSRPAATAPPTGEGMFTVQVSSWETRAKADEEAAKLSAAGYSAYVQEGSVAGEVWYRVRVGRYGSMREAQEAATQLERVAESAIWVAQISE